MNSSHPPGAAPSQHAASPPAPGARSGGESASGVSLHTLAWVAALLPFITIHATYLLAAAHGHVEWCVPYWDSCTSISATGRQLPEKIWFKLGMMPGALCTLLLWWCASAWRRLAAPTRYRRTQLVLPWLGSVAVCMLLMYTAALGEEGVAYQLMRRIGVTLAFALTFMAQLLLTRLIGELALIASDPWLARWHRRLFALNVLLLAVGVVSVALGWYDAIIYNAVEDAFEWVMALLLNLYFAGLALLWKKQDPRLGIQSQ